METMLSVTEFCWATGISRSTWQKMKRDWNTPMIVTVGGVQRLRRAAVETWLAENDQRPPVRHGRIFPIAWPVRPRSGGRDDGHEIEARDTYLRNH